MKNATLHQKLSPKLTSAGARNFVAKNVLKILLVAISATGDGGKNVF